MLAYERPCVYSNASDADLNRSNDQTLNLQKPHFHRSALSKYMTHVNSMHIM